MDIGIGLPNSLLGVRGPELIEWARRSEDAGFSVLGSIGRIVYDTHEELVALAAAAGATSRIDLMTTVLVGPPRQAVLLAKQAATLAAVSGGRFRLGVGLGPRDDDWLALGADPSGKGAKLDSTLETCLAVWRGEGQPGAEDPVGPKPIGLKLVLGGYSELAFRRAGRLADAFVAAPMAPDEIGRAYGVVKEAAAEAGRPTPSLHACRYAALGDDVGDEADANVASYYAFLGPDMVTMIQEGVLRTPEQVQEAKAALEEVGVKEFVLWPMSASIDQVEHIAAAAMS